MRRSVVFVAHRVKEVSLEHCEFGGEDGPPSPQTNGIFYTDPYFTTIAASGTDTSLSGLEPIRQFIAENFAPLDVGGHRAITNEDPWAGISSYDGNMIRGFHNMEFAIKVLEN